LKILTNPKTLISDFIRPVLEMNKKGKTAIMVDETDLSIYTTHNSEETSVTFYQKFKPKSILEPVNRFNIDLNTLSGGLNCLTHNPDEIVLDVNKSAKAVSYKDTNVSFKIRTVEDEMAPTATFNPKKLEEYKGIVDEFILSPKVLADLKKADAFAQESLKFYLEKEDDKLYCLFGDKKQNHLNSVKVLIRENIEHDIPEYIYRNTFIRSVYNIKTPITMKILDNGVLVCLTETENSKSIYCTSKLKQ
jgi:hypothetical protein